MFRNYTNLPRIQYFPSCSHRAFGRSRAMSSLEEPPGLTLNRSWWIQLVVGKCSSIQDTRNFHRAKSCSDMRLPGIQVQNNICNEKISDILLQCFCCTGGSIVCNLHITTGFVSLRCYIMMRDPLNNILDVRWAYSTKHAYKPPLTRIELLCHSEAVLIAKPKVV